MFSVSILSDFCKAAYEIWRLLKATSVSVYIEKWSKIDWKIAGEQVYWRSIWIYFALCLKYITLK